MRRRLLPRVPALGDQLAGESGVRLWPDPECRCLPQNLKCLLEGHAGVDIASRFPGHREVELLERRELRRNGDRLGGESVRQVEVVGLQVVRHRERVQGPADADRDIDPAQQCPDGRVGRVRSLVVLPKLAIMCISSLTPRCRVGQVVHGDRWPRSAAMDVKQVARSTMPASADPGWSAT
ncbi:MAG: hypothetical protein WKF73_04485 [Nocardioidaceae bacterium]